MWKKKCLCIWGSGNVYLLEGKRWKHIAGRSSNGKKLSTKLQTVHIIKWIFFAISDFATIEKILLSCHQLFEIFISSCQEFELHSALSLDTPVEIRFFLAALTSPFCPIYPAGQPASKPPVLYVEMCFTWTFLENTNGIAYKCNVWSNFYQILAVFTNLSHPKSRMEIDKKSNIEYC